MNLENVTRDDWIVGGLALLLALDLLILPWFSFPGVSVSIGGATIAYGGGSLTATDVPSGWLGILAVIAGAAIVADIAVERFSPQTQIPSVGGSRTMTRFVLAAAAALFLGLKFLFHVGHFGNLGFGFWAAVVLTAGLLFFSAEARQSESIAPSKPAGRAGPSGSGGQSGSAGSSSPPTA